MIWVVAVLIGALILQYYFYKRVIKLEDERTAAYRLMLKMALDDLFTEEQITRLRYDLRDIDHKITHFEVVINLNETAQA
jgi:hypothetical protein